MRPGGASGPRASDTCLLPHGLGDGLAPTPRFLGSSGSGEDTQLPMVRRKEAPCSSARQLADCSCLCQLPADSHHGDASDLREFVIWRERHPGNQTSAAE